MGYEVSQLLKMSQAELDALFSASEAGPIPDGQADGTAIIAPAPTSATRSPSWSTSSPGRARCSTPTSGTLRNRILPFGLNAIVAKVYKAPSWLDGKECIVLDYSETSMVAQWIRDEIRLIAAEHLSRQGLLEQVAADRLRARVLVLTGAPALAMTPRRTSW